MCSCKKGLKAPRPYPIQIPQFPQKPFVKTVCKEYAAAPAAPVFKPIGDVCNCGQTIVKPAPHPSFKPCPVSLFESHLFKLINQNPLKCMKGLPKWEFKHKPACSCSSCTAPKDSEENHHNHECGELKRAPKEFSFEFENRKKP